MTTELIATVSESLSQGGSTQSYALFSAEPIVTSSQKPQKIYTNVVAVADNVHINTGTATFNIRKSLQAICGQLELDDDPGLALFGENSPNPPSVGSIVEVSDKRPVVLGSKKSNGEPVPGTQWNVQVIDNETPTFSTSQSASSENAFSIKTSDDFNAKDAKSKHYFVGFGGPMTQTVGPYALWVPAPNQAYQIVPQNTFYILIDSVEPKSILSPEQKASATKVDFNALGYDSAKLVHDDKGHLNILTPGADLG